MCTLSNFFREQEKFSIIPTFVLVLICTLISGASYGQVKEVFHDEYYKNPMQNIFAALEKQAAPPSSPELYEPKNSIPLYSGDDYCFRKISVFESVLFKWERAGNRSINDEEAFWKKYLASDYTISRYRTLGKYLGTEEGQIKPIRTGHEVQFYNSIKAWLHHAGPNDKLSLYNLFTLGLDACKDYKNEANLQETFLTIHNVVRVLARPELSFAPTGAGDYPIAATDPIHFVMQDISGERASDGKQTLWDMLKDRPGRFPELTIIKGFSAWKSYTMFNVFNKQNGIFQFLEQCEEAGPSTSRSGYEAEVEESAWNGGSHYYFWIGALAQSTMGYAAIVYGGEQEEWLKWIGSWGKKGLDRQGEVEVAHMYCAGTVVSKLMNFADAVALAYPASANPGAAPKYVNFADYTGTYSMCYSENDQFRMSVSIDKGEVTYEITAPGRNMLSKGGGTASYKGSYKDAIVFKGDANVWHNYKNKFMSYQIEITLTPIDQIADINSPWSEVMSIMYKDLHAENLPAEPDGGSSFYKVK